MKWRMTFITLTIATGIAQADFLDEMTTARSEDYKFKFDMSSRSRTGHVETAGFTAAPTQAGLGISPDNRHVREWRQRIGEPGAPEKTVRDARSEYQ